MALPSNVSFGTFKGNIMRAVADGADSDRNPDGIPMSGLTVKFIPSVDQFKNVTAVPPRMIIADPITATTDSEGFIVGDDGVRSVRLLATDDESLQPTGWTWGVAISGTGFRTISFSFALPADDGTEENATDLATVARVPSSPGGALADWVAAVDATQAAAVTAGTAAAVAVDAAARAEAIPASSDALMRANLDIPGGEFVTELTANIAERIPPLNVMDYGVVGDGSASDQVAFVAAATAAKEQKRTLWVPQGLTGVRLTAPVDARYLDVLLESPVVIDHMSQYGILLGDTALQTNRRNLSWMRITNKTASPTIPSVRLMGLKSAMVMWGATDYVQFFADATTVHDSAIAYCTFISTGAPIDTLEFFGQNGTAWINDNKFFGGRFRKKIWVHGSYTHNGNKFYGPTIEGCEVLIERGSDTHFLDVRAEGDPTAYFSAGTWGIRVLTSYAASAGTLNTGFATVTDLGVNNVVTSAVRSNLTPVEVFRFDRHTRAFNATSEHPSTSAGTPIPGLRLLRVRAINQLILDSGILSIEQVPDVTAVAGESNARLTRLMLASSHRLWRPRVYCYDANMQILDPTAKERILSIGGWVANGDFYALSAVVASARIQITDSAVKYIRITISSSAVDSPAFEWVSLTAFVKSPDLDGIARLWQRALTQPLYQSAKPIEGAARVGERVGAFLCTGRFDTTLTAAAAAATTTIGVVGISGIASGDLIGVLLTDGTTHWTTVNGAPSSGTVVLTVGLTGAASIGAAVVTNRWA